MGMNGKQVIDIIHTDLKVLRVQNGFELNAKGRLAGLHKKLWNWAIAKGIITPSFMDHETRVRVLIDGGTLFERLLDQYEEVFDRIRNPRQVFMGPDDLREIMHIRELQDYNGGPFSLNAQGMISSATGNKRLFDLPVTVVPYMKGVLIV